MAEKKNGGFRTSIGGQALIEGILMRGPEKQAIVVRDQEGKLVEKVEELRLIKDKHPILGVPLIRGTVNFLAAMVNGVKALMYSADFYPDDEAAQPSKLDLWLEQHLSSKKLESAVVGLSVVLGVGMSILLFLVLPTLLTGAVLHFFPNFPLWGRNVMEGLLKILIFLLYLFLCSRLKDIHRVFQYHGAEHKCIHCFESGRELTPENCQEFYTLHPRCGTSFLVFVLVISLIVFSFLGWPNLALRIVSRLLLIPFIAGISYEVLKWAGKSDNWFIKIISIPGLYLQKLTTAPPDNEQLEVAIAAVKAVMDEDAPLYEGIAGKDGKFIKTAEEFYKEAGV